MRRLVGVTRWDRDQSPGDPLEPQSHETEHREQEHPHEDAIAGEPGERGAPAGAAHLGHADRSGVRVVFWRRIHLIELGHGRRVVDRRPGGAGVDHRVDLQRDRLTRRQPDGPPGSERSDVPRTGARPVASPGRPRRHVRHPVRQRVGHDHAGRVVRTLVGHRDRVRDHVAFVRRAIIDHDREDQVSRGVGPDADRGGLRCSVVRERRVSDPGHGGGVDHGARRRARRDVHLHGDRPGTSYGERGKGARDEVRRIRARTL